MSSKELEITTIDSDPMSTDRLKTLFFLSFKYSQGSTSLQENIFDWHHYLHPTWKLDENFKRDFRAVVKPTIVSFLHQPSRNHDLESQYHSYQPEHKIESEINTQINKMKRAYNSKSHYDPTKQILEGVIDADFMFLCAQDGRDRIYPDTNVTSKDRYLSHLLHYGLKGQPTGAPEYDSMFASISAYLRAHQDQYENLFHSPSKDLKLTYGMMLRQIEQKYVSTRQRI